MYSYIKGIIKKITPKYIVLENNAIGYQIITANPYSFSLNEELTVFVYQYVKEDITIHRNICSSALFVLGTADTYVPDTKRTDQKESAKK